MTTTTKTKRTLFSPRRKSLLALIVVVLSVVAWLNFIGAAGISGTATQDMDWDGNGTVTRNEVLQAFHAVAVTKTSEGQRECVAYYWRSDKRPIRVDCRTSMAPAATKE